MTEETIVRENLMTLPEYTPYCGSDSCILRNPRTSWSISNNQFVCGCSWVSKFHSVFIKKYKKKWNTTKQIKIRTIYT